MIQVTACLRQHLGQQPWAEQPGVPRLARPFPVRHAPSPTRSSGTGGSAGQAGDGHPGTGGPPASRSRGRCPAAPCPPPRHRHRRRRGRTPAAAGPWHLPAPLLVFSSLRATLAVAATPHAPRPAAAPALQSPAAAAPPASLPVMRPLPAPSRPVPPSRRADPPPAAVGLSRRPHLRFAPFAARGGAEGGGRGGRRARPGAVAASGV